MARRHGADEPLSRAGSALTVPGGARTNRLVTDIMAFERQASPTAAHDFGQMPPGH